MKKNTAYRPSQSNQQYVKNSRGEKVLNIAYQGNNHSHNLSDISHNDIRGDFVVEDDLEVKEKVHPILKHTTCLAEYIDNMIEIYPLKSRDNTDFDMSVLDDFDDIFGENSGQDYKELAEDFAYLINDNKLQYTDVGSAKTIYNCILNNIELYDKHYESFYNKYKMSYDANPELFKASFAKNSFDSRGTGQLFGKYINTLPESVNLDNLESHEGICITTGNGNNSDKKLKEYCNKKFNLSLNKGIDAIGKGKSGKYYIFEAKYLTTKGGGQNHQLNNALDVSLISTKQCQGVAVLDGTFIIRDDYPKIRNIFSKSGNNNYNDKYVISATEIIEFLSDN